MYAEAYEGLLDAAEEIFSERPRFQLGMQDHAWAALNAKTKKFANISVGTCWAHAARKMGEKMNQQQLDEDTKKTLIAAVNGLHAITDDGDFSHAMMLFYEDLASMKLTEFAKWFKKHYDADGIWLKWHLGGRSPQISNSDCFLNLPCGKHPAMCCLIPKLFYLRGR